MTIYEGGCHCGAVRYKAELELANLMTCNCSICGKTGNIMTFIPVDKFTLLKGADEQTDYTFNKKVIHHPFCKHCGVRSFGRGEMGGQAMVMINARCLDGVDVHTLKVSTQYDGRSL